MSCAPDFIQFIKILFQYRAAFRAVFSLTVLSGLLLAYYLLVFPCVRLSMASIHLARKRECDTSNLYTLRLKKRPKFETV